LSTDQYRKPSNHSGGTRSASPASRSGGSASRNVFLRSITTVFASSTVGGIASNSGDR